MALEYMLTHSYKAGMVAHMKSHPEDFDKAIKLAIADQQPYSWRAAWMLKSCMEKNDVRIQGYINQIIEVLHLVSHSQLRELLSVLQQMELNEEQEGRVFDVCISIWERTDKQASVRINALKMIVKIIKKYPELSGELQFLTEPQYLESLSHGIRRSAIKMMAAMDSKEPKP